MNLEDISNKKLIHNYFNKYERKYYNNLIYYILIIIVYITIIIILIYFKFVFKISSVFNNIINLLEQNRKIFKNYNNLKQRIVALSYADKKYQNQLLNNKKSAIEIGKVDDYYSYGPDDIDSNFKNKNKDILSRKRGNGYWLWKPYFILKTLREKLNEGDYLFYTDAGILYMDSTEKVVNFLKENHFEMWVIKTKYIEKYYSKRDAFILLGVDMPSYSESFQYMAGIQIYKKSIYTEKFLEKLLYYSQDKRIITDEPNIQGQKNYRGFIENRHDQTVLSLLTKKFEIFNTVKTNLNIRKNKNIKRKIMPNIFCIYKKKKHKNYDDIRNICAKSMRRKK